MRRRDNWRGRLKWLIPNLRWRLRRQYKSFVRWFRQRLTLRSLRNVFAVLLSLVMVAGALLLIQSGYTHSWTGFGEYVDPNGNIDPAKTLWDWMSLLLVPIVLALAALTFNWVERTTERQIASDRIQQSVLQNYFDRMSELMFEHKLQESNPGDQVRNVARARTLAVLRELDGKYKGSVMRFLAESKLIIAQGEVGNEDPMMLGFKGKVLVDLSGADLSSADMSGLYMKGVQLEHANLRGANLLGARLYNANLVSADLSYADLRWSQLIDSLFRLADLRWADTFAIGVRSVDFSGAKVTLEQLMDGPWCQNVIMPDGRSSEEWNAERWGKKVRAQH